MGNGTKHILNDECNLRLHRERCLRQVVGTACDVFQPRRTGEPWAVLERTDPLVAGARVLA